MPNYDDFVLELQKKVSHFKEYLSYLEESNGNTYFTKIAKIIVIMLYYYVLKQIGFQEAIKYLLLYGKQSKGKTVNSYYY